MMVSPFSQLRDSINAFGLECDVSDGQDLIQQNDVWIQMGNDGEPQAHVHT